jgi:NO-binding membrane sensor protein with MHYT domain
MAGVVVGAGSAARAVSGMTALPAAPAIKLRRLKPDVVVLSLITASAA